MSKKKKEQRESYKEPFICMIDEKGRKIVPKPIHISLRKMRIFERHDAVEADRRIGISPLDVIHETLQEIKRKEKIFCAMLDAGDMFGREYQLSAILDYVEKKYSATVNDIRKIAGDYLTRKVTEGESFGLVTPFERAEHERIRQAFNLDQEKKEEGDAAGS
jgi:hypothetical protein